MADNHESQPRFAVIKSELRACALFTSVIVSAGAVHVHVHQGRQFNLILADVSDKQWLLLLLLRGKVQRFIVINQIYSRLNNKVVCVCVLLKLCEECVDVNSSVVRVSLVTESSGLEKV